MELPLQAFGAEALMESKAKLLGHPIHQMLVVLPLGVLAMSLVFDLIARTLRPRLM